VLVGETPWKFESSRPHQDNLLKSFILSLCSCSVTRFGTQTDLFIHQQAIDTSTPAGKALFSMIGVFAEYTALHQHDVDMDGVLGILQPLIVFLNTDAIVAQPPPGRLLNYKICANITS
jgi:hypothetical protein